MACHTSSRVCPAFQACAAWDKLQHPPPHTHTHHFHHKGMEGAWMGVIEVNRAFLFPFGMFMSKISSAVLEAMPGDVTLSCR